MTMDDFQFMDSFKRKRIKLTLKTATFLGIVQRINANKTVILEDVVDVKNGRKFPGVKLFFGHEILNVEFPNVTKTDRENSSDHRPEGHLTVAEFQPYRKSLILNEDDESHVNFVVIDEFHEKFGPAVMLIRKQQVIGIGADGVGTFQHERLCWLQIATKNTVYLFDILLLGARAFKNGLSMILENSHILKVTHDCRSLAGSLMAQFGVNLTNIFDTQVADILCFYTETGGFLPDRVSTLQEVVSLHLKMSSSQLSSLNIKSLLTKEDKAVWYVRPCPLSLLKVMALSVIHLQPLRLVLLDALMADYTGLVDSYLSGSREEPVHMQNVGSSSVLELPRELRALEHMRQVRQKWAIDRYPITEQGLLERSNPRPLPPSQNGQNTATQRQPDPPVPTAVEPVVLAPVPGQGPAETPRTSNTLWASDLHAMTSALTQEAGVLRPVAPSGAPGLLEIVMDTMAGRGRSLLKDPTPPALPVFPSLGRGLALPIPAAQVPKESPGALKTQAPVGRVEVPVPPGPRPSPVQPFENIPGAGRGLFIQKPQGLTSPLSLSFSSFRKSHL
ncbi:piRNA biogenesis protein EXD1 isoform X1 [Coregonus clupeaformis]|uniref:piRNA biogenesis protein EXD1 isoform X1 n=1 Tax=Coregonus clupeaformis TaxID=59861 RepID=UPI001BE09532|nr:piRNA biogenesis protein EXD1 isoform X1 [Coregonus clupeaformis]